MSKPTFSKDELKKIFDDIDTDKNQKLSKEEFTTFAQKTGNHISAKDVNNIFKHMNLDDDENTITFEEFYYWYQNGKEKNLLPLLYFKQQVDKKLNEAKDKIKSSSYDVNKAHATPNSFSASIQNGKNNKELCIEMKVSTQSEGDKLSQAYREKLGLGNCPAVVFKIKASKDVNEAKRSLEDLIDQAKQFLECILPAEYSEMYLALVDIKVESDGNYLLVSVSTQNEIVTALSQSYIALAQDLQFVSMDQSVTFSASLSSQLDIGKAVENPSVSVLGEFLKGLNIDIQQTASSLILENLRVIFYAMVETELKKNNNNLSNRKAREYGQLVLLSLLNGVSVKLNANKIEEILPPEVTKFTFEEFLKQLKQNNKAEEAIGLPIFQDAINFFNEFTSSDFSLAVFSPQFFGEIHFCTKNLSSLLNKFFS